jgi:hypothetical protein
MNKQIQAAKELPIRISKWSRSRGAKDALRSALAFTIGQLLCFLPGYDNLWRALRVKGEKSLLMFCFGFRKVERNFSRGSGSLYHFGRRIEADRSVHPGRCSKLILWSEGGFLDQLIFRLGGGKIMRVLCLDANLQQVSYLEAPHTVSFSSTRITRL